MLVVERVGLSALTSAGASPNATITTFEPRAAVGNESAAALSGSNDVVTCNDQGPIPGDAGLSGRLLVERPVGVSVAVTARVELDNCTAVAEATETETVTVAERARPCEDEREG